jgi:hypothetical protein
MEVTKKIEEYLDGTMNDIDRRAFEEQAKCDAGLRNLVGLHKEVNEYIKDVKFQALINNVQKVAGELPDATDSLLHLNDKEPAKLSRQFFLKVAVVLFFILITGITLKIVLFEKTSPEKLFQQFYQSYNTDLITRSEQILQSNLDKAILTYHLGEYKESLSILDNLIQNNKDNYLAFFYKGLNCLEVRDIPNALISFENIPESWNSPLKEHRNWYYAMALLMSGNTTKAKAMFLNISAGKGYYADNADRILKKLKS